MAARTPNGRLPTGRSLPGWHRRAVGRAGGGLPNRGRQAAAVAGSGWVCADRMAILRCQGG